MFIKEFIPEEKLLSSNYIVIKNAKLIKKDQKALKNDEPIHAEEPVECFQYCSKVADNRCNFVEYNEVDKLCEFYNLSQDDKATLKFKYSDKEINGEVFTPSTVESLKQKDITVKECIDLFNSNSKSIFYNYNEKDSECVVGIATESNNNSFAINLNSFGTASLSFNNPNIKNQVGGEEVTTQAGKTPEQKKGSKEGNLVSYALVVLGIIGVVLISGLVYYGIRMVRKANKLNENSRNARTQVSYKIKNSDPYSNGSRGSKNSTLNNSRFNNYSSRSQSSVSNIAPQIYDYNDAATYVNNGNYPSSVTNSLNSYQPNNNLQDFYNNASLSFGVPNYGNANYGSNYGSSNNSYSNYKGYDRY